MAYHNFLSALVDDGDNGQGKVSRNDLVALWDGYAGPNKPEGKFLFTCLLEWPDIRYHIL